MSLNIPKYHLESCLEAHRVEGVTHWPVPDSEAGGRPPPALSREECPEQMHSGAPTPCHPVVLWKGRLKTGVQMYSLSRGTGVLAASPLTLTFIPRRNLCCLVGK